MVKFFSKGDQLKVKLTKSENLPNRIIWGSFDYSAEFQEQGEGIICYILLWDRITQSPWMNMMKSGGFTGFTFEIGDFGDPCCIECLSSQTVSDLSASNHFPSISINFHQNLAFHFATRLMFQASILDLTPDPPFPGRWATWAWPTALPWSKGTTVLGLEICDNMCRYSYVWLYIYIYVYQKL